MRKWKVVLHLTDHAADHQTGETFKHLSKNAVLNLVLDRQALSQSGVLILDRSYIEEEEK